MDNLFFNKDYDQVTNEDLQNQFTAYLNLALRRKRNKFISKMKNDIVICDSELLEEVISSYHAGGNDQNIQEEWGSIIHTMKSKSLKKGLLTLNTAEAIILFRRAIRGEKFEIIARDLQMPIGSVATKFYRTIKKLERAAKGE